MESSSPVASKRPVPSTKSLVDSRLALLFAVGVIVALRQWQPYGREILYPFTLLSTWVHEMGHGLTAILVGGRFESLQIYGNASGLAYTSTGSGLARALVCAGGLLGPPLAGCLFLSLSRRLSRLLLLSLAVVMLLSLVLWVRTLVGWVTVGGIGVLVGVLARFAGTGLRQFFTQLLGLLFCLDAVTRSDYLFTERVVVAGRESLSDVGTIASALGGPYFLWGTLLAGLSLLMILVGGYLALRSPASAPVA